MLLTKRFTEAGDHDLLVAEVIVLTIGGVGEIKAYARMTRAAG